MLRFGALPGCFAVCVENSVPVASRAMARSGLGKGLGALIGTPAIVTPKDGSEAGGRVHQIELTSIVPSTLQPRKDFARDALLELIESIRRHRHYSAAHRPSGRHAI